MKQNQRVKEIAIKREQDGYEERVKSIQQDINIKHQKADVIKNSEKQFLIYRQRVKEEQEKETQRAYV